MLTLGQSGFVSGGDFTGSLPGSMGSTGSSILEVIGKGIDLTTTILNRNRAPAQTPASVIPLLDIERMDAAIKGAGTLVKLPEMPASLMQTALSAPSSRLLTKSGKPRRIKANGQPWKVPSMNPLNPRALRRSMKRVQRFAKFASRTISFTKRVRMKKRRR